MRKVAVIGLDCATPQLVFDLWRDELPNLNALMARGVWGTLRSCDPPITVPAWASMLSSKDPGQLGLYGFRNRRSHAYDDVELAHANLVKHDRVWDILSRAGRQVILLGIPQTYPPPAVNGHVVSCFLTPSKARAFTYPAALREEVESVAGGYVFDVDDFRTADKAELLERIHAMTRTHFRVARHLLRTKPWDFFMMVEMGTDRIHHGFWQHCDPQDSRFEPGNQFEHAIRDYYRYVDGEVGELLSCLDPATLLLVVSDHGAQRMRGGIRINEWLRHNDYLRLRKSPAQPMALTAELVDWPATTAWGDGGYCGRIFLNVAGREPQGTVAPAQYERVRDELITAITAINGPDGCNLGARAYRPEELYSEVNGVAPDLIVYFGDLSWRAIGSVGGASLYAGENDTGPDGANHDWNGIFILRDGQRDLGGQRVDGLQLMDVAPTILQGCGVPVPSDMRGRPADSRSRRAAAHRTESPMKLDRVNECGIS